MKFINQLATALFYCKTMTTPFGGRGGDAHDEELLKELMAISNKRNRRFDDDAAVESADDTAASESNIVADEQKRRPLSASTASFATANEFASPMSADPITTDDVVVTDEDGYESDSNFLPNVDEAPSTQIESFQEDTGGSAQDVELTTSPSTNVLVDDDNGNILTETATLSTSTAKAGKFQSHDNLPKTFKGDRGGAAEDADLLAELRAISNKGSNRFDDDNNNDDDERKAPVTNAVHNEDNVVVEKKTDAIVDEAEEAPTPAPSQPLKPWQKKKPTQKHNVDIGVHSEQVFEAISSNVALPDKLEANDLMAYAVPPGSAPSIVLKVDVTLENLDESLKSSNWQLRKESYLFLTERMRSMLLNKDAANQLDGDEVFPSLINVVTKALNEKIAGAHDAALTLSIIFVDSCKDACSQECLKSIISALLNGSSFSSSRKTTMNLAEDLVLKALEVSPEDSSSIQTTLDLLHEHGLKSKKPKVVLFSSKLVLRAVHEFGVAVFPILVLSSHSETLISNSNNEVREVGLKIVAEVCRTLGSRSSLQSLIDKMKPAQQSQLDSLLSSNEKLNEPSRRLRCQKFLSTEDIEATMIRKQEEAKAQSFASRPAINLFQVLPETCYKEKIKLDKWSEKVSGLNALIMAGGEQPYKLLPPSDSVNYVPLIRELTKLLGHTHFAVVSKTLESFGMLSEGVGEDLYPQLRPLIPTFVALFKDKKVCKAVASCLDKMYGNVFSFGHLLDSKDSLPSALDEKTQKNALVRASVLDYLGRCVGLNECHGKKGQLTPQYAEELCKLGCLKAQDSDAETRKSASNLLLLLLKSKDSAIAAIGQECTATLQTSNPRLFKSLQKAMSGPPSHPPTNISSRPNTAPNKALSSRKVESARPVTAGAVKTTKADNRTLSANANDDDATKLLSLEEAIEKLSSLGIPNWSDSIDADGVLAGIQCKFIVLFFVYNIQLHLNRLLNKMCCAKSIYLAEKNGSTS